MTDFWTAYNDERTILLKLFMLDAFKLTHEVYKAVKLYVFMVAKKN